MNDGVSGLFKAEEARIRAVYADRQAASRYSCLDPGHLFMVQDRERQVLGLLERYGLLPLETKKILEIGCGSGFWLREFVKWGARPENIFGVDLLPGRIAEARILCPEGVSLWCGSASRLEYPDDTFDLVLQSTVFTSILDARLKEQIAREMLRVLKCEAAIIWYDFFVNNPRNPDVCGIRKRELRELFPDCDLRFKRITLAPPLARLLAPRSWYLCCLLTELRVFNTHYLALIRRKG